MNFLEVIFIILLVLKLTKIIAISWLWVFAPVWIPLTIAGILALIGKNFFRRRKPKFSRQ